MTTIICTALFLSTLSLRRATAETAKTSNADTNFYPRSPCGERLLTRVVSSAGTTDFYPRSPCGERLSTYRHQGRQNPISIHALLAESDLRVLDGSKSSIEISIHALLAESDVDEIPYQGQVDQFLSTLSLRRATPVKTVKIGENLIFLSTLSLRRATHFIPNKGTLRNNFYPRSPCGERRQSREKPRQTRTISIHALLAESDCRAGISESRYRHFYPRSPCGERPNDAINGCNPDFISIHALLAESDNLHPGYRALIHSFLSTLSLRRATRTL